MNKPAVGRIVHYTNLGDKDGRFPPEIQAAIITKVQGADVSLHIFYEHGTFDMIAPQAPDDVRAGTDAARGMWQWPARDDD